VFLEVSVTINYIGDKASLWICKIVGLFIFIIVFIILFIVPYIKEQKAKQPKNEELH
jgi:quinol-cytochrome oxidoreductase complex cytochrome b subunit